MTLERLGRILTDTGIPTVYHSWNDQDKDRPALPFLCYSSVYTHNMFADNKSYYIVTHVQIELYTALKDTVSEKTIEDALDDNELPWDKTETYLDSERCYQIIYEFDIGKEHTDVEE